MNNLEYISKNISKLLALDEKIKIINDKQKELKKERDTVEELVLDILNKNNLTNNKFRLENSSIFCTKNQTLPPFNSKLVEDILSNYMAKDKVDFLLKKIDDYRNNNRKENLVLKRKQIKNKSHKRKLLKNK
jgi:hypothetical protein